MTKNMICPKCKTDLPKGAEVCHVCGNKLGDESVQSEKQNQTQAAPGRHYNVPKKYRLAAVLLIVLPYVVLIAAILFYAIAAAAQVSGTAGSVLRTVFGVLGVIGVLGIIIGIPLAVLVGSRKKKLVTQFDPRSGVKDDSKFPLELKKWNWGAAGLCIIWGVYHGVWLSLISLIPYVNWIWWIFMGLEGNKWAWQSRYWKSVEEFKAAQKKWKIWGIIFFFLPIVLVVLGIIINIAAAF